MVFQVEYWDYPRAVPCDDAQDDMQEIEYVQEQVK